MGRASRPCSRPTRRIVFLGFALAGAHGLSTRASLIALGSFLIGALAGGWLAGRNASHRGQILRATTVAQAPLMALAIVIAALSPTPGQTVSFALAGTLALAMGLQNATALRLAVPDLTTSVLTRTLTGLASQGTLTGGEGSQLGRRMVAIVAMLGGALTGGLLVLNVSIASAVAVALAIVLAVALAAHLTSGSQAGWTHP